MRKTKKILSLILALSVLASLIAGCGDKKPVTTNNGGEFVPTEELELTVWNVQGTEHIPQEGPKENIPKTWLENKSKVKVANIYGNDGGQWDTKLSRLIAGDNLPDILYVAAGQGPAHFKKLQDAKKLYPLTEELIKQYAPNVWSRVPEKCWELMEADGKILGIPFGIKTYDEQTHPYASEEELAYLKKNNEDKTTNSVALHIRDDIAKKLFPEIKTFKELAAIIDETGKPLYDTGNGNIFPIKTTEEYIQMFRNIDAMKLEENGRKVFAFGYNGGDLWLPFHILGASMYGYATNNYISNWNPAKKEVVLPLMEDDLIKQSAKIQNQLIRENVFDPESLAHNAATFKENVLNGLYAVTSLDYSGGYIQTNNNLEKLGKDFRYIPLRVQVPQHSEEYPLQGYNAPWTAALTITDSLDDEQVKQVLNWINIQFSDEFEEILWWGTPEDGLYTEDENGMRTYVDDRFNQRYIEGDSKALSVADCRGIGSAVYSPEVEFYVLAGFSANNNHWSPRVMRQKNNITSGSKSAYYPTERAPEYQSRPQCLVYDAPFAAIEECVDFWAKREQWESPFKIALGADSEESFEKQWEEARQNMAEITDLDAMCQKMTEMARAQAKSMDIE